MIFNHFSYFLGKFFQIIERSQDKYKIVLFDEVLWPSVRGPVYDPACQLRDPAIFEENGKVYMLYSVAGERGIAIAELIF